MGEPAAVLTREMLERAFEEIRQEDHRPHDHIVHPRALTVDGWYACDCGMLPIRGGKVDWDWGLAQLREAGAL